MIRAIPLCLLALLAGCAIAADSPSLAPRPIEQRFNAPEAPPAPPPGTAPADASLAARIDALLAQLRSGDAAFSAALAEAERAVSAAGAMGSETWVVAQQRLSGLEGARAPSTLALGGIDTLLVTHIASGRPGVAELQTAQSEAERVTAAQTARIDSLRSRLAA